MLNPDPPPGPLPGPTLGILIRLLHEAALRLQQRGQGPYQRIRTLRGLYYGTSHSLDFERRQSRSRNWGFNLYRQNIAPPDPTPVLGASLVRALKDSAVVRHQDRWMDAGHILAGLEPWTRLGAARLPLLGQGGTGLELGTWLGDLGGAAGLLVLQRLENPMARAVPLLFPKHTYDLRPDLEGDVARYLVARDPIVKDHVSLLKSSQFVSVAHALEDYAQKPESDWADRWRLFARPWGPKRAAPPAHLSRRQDLLAWVRKKIQGFTNWYLLDRLQDAGRMSRATLAEAFRHVEGAAAELSELFLSVLEQGLPPGASMDLPDLPASPPGPPRGLLALGRLAGG